MIHPFQSDFHFSALVNFVKKLDTSQTLSPLAHKSGGGGAWPRVLTPPVSRPRVPRAGPGIVLITAITRVQVILNGPPSRRQLIVTSHQSLFMHFFRLVEGAVCYAVNSGAYQVFLSCVVCQVCVAPP